MPDSGLQRGITLERACLSDRGWMSGASVSPISISPGKVPSGMVDIEKAGGAMALSAPEAAVVAPVMLRDVR